MPSDGGWLVIHPDILSTADAASYVQEMALARDRLLNGLAKLQVRWGATQ
jgi:hypothetical protein